MRSLCEISKISDIEIVRIWLRDRGLVAVDRELMNRLAAVDRKLGVVYDPSTDRFHSVDMLSKSG